MKKVQMFVGQKQSLKIPHTSITKKWRLYEIKITFCALGARGLAVPDEFVTQGFSHTNQ
jgi:hypothetical protein